MEAVFIRVLAVTLFQLGGDDLRFHGMTCTFDKPKAYVTCLTQYHISTSDVESFSQSITCVATRDSGIPLGTLFGTLGNKFEHSTHHPPTKKTVFKERAEKPRFNIVIVGDCMCKLILQNVVVSRYSLKMVSK